MTLKIIIPNIHFLKDKNLNEFIVSCRYKGIKEIDRNDYDITIEVDNKVLMEQIATKFHDLFGIPVLMIFVKNNDMIEMVTQ